jgi:predicted glutamine amidotransferase
MCRWMAYTGQAILLEDLLFTAKHNLIDQSMCSKSAETPTNGDGFGVGWYAEARYPGLFRSIRPAWNDFNLRDLAAHIRSPLFLAHVRATSQATVQETNCHPFRFKNWLFVHNGEISEIERLRRDLLLAVAPELFPNILGSTDSELMFFLALTFGMEQNPLQGLARMAGFVEKTAAAHGVREALWMTVGVSDGRSVYAVRYASDGDAPTLYHSLDTEAIYHLNPDIRERFGDNARAIVSEPIGLFPEIWRLVPANTFLHVKDACFETHPFLPLD